MHNNLNMLALPEIALLVELYYQNRESALQFYDPIVIGRIFRAGKRLMTSSALKTMISKFKGTSCLDDRPHNG